MAITSRKVDEPVEDRHFLVWLGEEIARFEMSIEGDTEIESRGSDYIDLCQREEACCPFEYD